MNISHTTSYIILHPPVIAAFTIPQCVLLFLNCY